jgi:hypothetical protein
MRQTDLQVSNINHAARAASCLMNLISRQESARPLRAIKSNAQAQTRMKLSTCMRGSLLDIPPDTPEPTAYSRLGLSLTTATSRHAT